MQKPGTPVAAPPTPSASPSASPSAPPSAPAKQPKEAQSMKPPTAAEVIAHYEAQGVDSKEAPLKAIEDLQNVLMRVLGSGRGRKDKFMGDTMRKLDSVNTRLAILEVKMDSKPGYGESVAIGVASGLAARGIGNVMPQVLGALGQMWDSVKSSTRST
ncbi:hypothetical protein H6P81_009270 [Aristolochia fimbriata]|uniref:Uncharacterized protein n=1 Tax=Aristolochia fimbriata TaxID=158543 RepID=A0AAV7EMH0_ARIFI|nr:hypothetical protein H6P81_009270 [Aristolochia fimbriata]